MKIGIIFAMQEELDAFLSKVDDFKSETCKSLKVYHVKHNSHNCVCVLSGIGKVNAAYATTLLINTYAVEAVLNSGVAGGVNVALGTTIIASGVVHHDVDVTAFNYAYGQVPGAEVVFKSDKALKALAMDIAEQAGIHYRSGMIASGDQFITRKASIEAILALYENVYAVEMEAAAIAQVCTLEKVPHLILRAISDVIGEPAQSEGFSAFLAESSENAAKLLVKLIDAL